MKAEEIFGIFLLFCLIIFFCISGYHMRGMIILGVIGMVLFALWEMNK